MAAGERYSIEFYESPQGQKPVLRWIRHELTVRQRRALGYAMYRLLERYGVGVCESEFGRHLGEGLFEFRLRMRADRDGEDALLRVFCHAEGDHLILLMGGYDKGKHPSQKRQDVEIRTARRRLRDHLNRRAGRQGPSGAVDRI